MIQIYIETGNSAFVDAGVGAETARIVRKLANRIGREGIPEVGDTWPLMDSNGNNIGGCRTEEGI